VIASDRRQVERTQSFEAYLRHRVTPWVVRRGRELAAEHRELLAQIREQYGVPPEIVVAIWGFETGYGQHGGTVPVFQALATLAWDPRRARLFRAQLYDALTMVDRGHIDAPSMLGSWAGAMGQPQFMPSSYLAYAVDFDSDGRRDIWTSPADTLASIANYLRGHGWRADEPWGREVLVPKRVSVRARRAGCRAMREMTASLRMALWRRLGVRALGGDASAAPDASLVRAGKRRFLVHANYDALLHYNCAHHYAGRRDFGGADWGGAVGIVPIVMRPSCDTGGRCGILWPHDGGTPQQ
jgi:membrane-bound lytic murein transglycosylase B